MTRSCERVDCGDFAQRQVGCLDWSFASYLALDEIAQAFLKLCYLRLQTAGKLIVVTDNAEWFPFYLPIDMKGTGIGAHSEESYSLRFNAVHLSIFSPMHLREHLLLAGFKRVKVRRMWQVLGARLEGVGTK